MSNEYIPVATASTVYHKPETQQEFDELAQTANVGDMIFSKWVFQASGGMWYTVGLIEKSDPTTKMLFPNIILGENLPPLTRWGIQRRDFLKEHRKFFAAPETQKHEYNRLIGCSGGWRPNCRQGSDPVIRATQK